MKSLKKGGFWSKLRMPHIFTLLFGVIVLVGIVSLIMSYAGITYETQVSKNFDINAMLIAKDKSAAYSESVAKALKDGEIATALQKVNLHEDLISGLGIPESYKTLDLSVKSDDVKAYKDAVKSLAGSYVYLADANGDIAKILGGEELGIRNMALEVFNLNTQGDAFNVVKDTKLDVYNLDPLKVDSESQISVFAQALKGAGLNQLAIIPNGQTYVDVEENSIKGAGILEWIGAIPAGVVNAVWVIVFLLILGGFINVIIQSKALEAFMGRIGLKLKNTEIKTHEDKTSFSRYAALTGEFFRHTWVILPLVMFFAFAGTTYGMAEESLAFYVIIIPLTMAAGFDMWTGFLIIFAGAGIGVMASTVNPFSVLVANDTMKTAAGQGYSEEIVENVKNAAGSGLVWRWVTWAVLSSMTAGFVMFYAFRVKKNKAVAKFADMFEVHNKQFGQRSAEIPALTKRRLITTILFMLTFVVLVLGMLNYDNLAGRDYDTGVETAGSPLKAHYDNFVNNNATSWFHNDSVAQSSAFGGGFGWEFGWWYWLAITSLFIIMTIVMGVINRNSEQEFMQNVTIGAKDMLAVSLAVGISRGVSVLLKGTNMEQYFAKELADVLAKSEGNKNITIPLISYILFIPLTFVIPSTSGLAGATFGVIGPSIAKVEALNPEVTALSGVVTGYAMGAGFANMFVPTYAVVIGAIAITKISFVRFAKSIASFLGLAFVAGLLMIVIGGAVTTADNQIF